MKIRIKFAKQGTMKFIGHLDIMRYFQKIMRRAEVNIRYSEGFSPHQIMSFASPLGVGMTSNGEYVDIEVHSSDSSEEMLRRINAVMVEGMEALSYRLLPDDAANAMSIVAAADYTVAFRPGREPKNWERFVSELPAFLAQESIPVLKKTKKGEREIDIKPLIYGFTIDAEAHTVWMKIASGSAANLKPDLVLDHYLRYLGEEPVEFAYLMNREEVYANRAGEGEPIDLITLADFGEDIV